MSKICSFIIFILILLIVFNIFYHFQAIIYLLEMETIQKLIFYFLQIMINYQMINHCKEIEDLLSHRLLSVS